MKFTAFILCTFAGLSALAFPIEDGVYQGPGYFQMSNSGVKNHYNATVENNKGQMLMIYEARGTSSVVITLDQDFDGSYSVTVQGVPDRGVGYCLDDKKLCHYEFMAGRVKFEETIIQTGEQLEKFGSKYDVTAPGTPRVSWYENLKLVKTPTEN